MKLNIQLFAGSVTIGTITETTDINTNQSTFTIPATLTTSGATFNNDDAYMTLQWKYASASSWTSLSKKTFGIGQNTSKTKSWSLSLTHEPDGSLEKLNFRVKWYVTSSTNGTSSTKSFTPDDIPRASVPTLSSSSIDMGSSVTINTNRYSSSFTHTITYSFGNASGTIATNVGTSTTWTPPLTLANQIPTATSGIATITCITYNGGNEVGRKTTNLTLNVPSSVVPTTPTMTRTEVGDIPDDWGVLVQSKSKLRFNLSSSGAYGSTIASYNLTFDGYTYSSAESTTGYINGTSYQPVTFYSIDSRGRKSTTGGASLYIYSYTKPTISTAQVQRCDANGNINNEGQYCWVSYNASIKRIADKNTPYGEFKISYGVHNTGNYTEILLGTGIYEKNVEGLLYTDGIYPANRGTGTKVQLSTSNTYDILFYAKDYFTESTNVQLLDTGFDLMNFNANGKAMAIGKVSEATGDNQLLEIALPTTYSGTYIKDELVVENIKSKNMIDNMYYLISSSGTSSTLSTGIRAITSSTGTNQYSVYKLPNSLLGKTCTLSFTASASSSNTPMVRIYYGNGTSLSNMVKTNANFDLEGAGNKSKTATFQNSFPTDCNGIYLLVYANRDGTGFSSGAYCDYTNLQLEEGTTKTSYSPHQNLDIKDSGWHRVTLTSNFKYYNNDESDYPKYRKFGPIVNFRGCITPTATLSTSSDQTICTLPEGFRPYTEAKAICQGSGMNRWLLSIYEGGEVKLSRYGVSSQDSVYAGNWLPFNITFFTMD